MMQGHATTRCNRAKIKTCVVYTHIKKKKKQARHVASRTAHSRPRALLFCAWMSSSVTCKRQIARGSRMTYGTLKSVNTHEGTGCCSISPLSFRGHKWSLKILQCSQNKVSARNARNILVGIRLLVLACSVFSGNSFLKGARCSQG